MAPRKRETTVKQVLSDARETNFGDEKSWKKFQKTHAVRLSKGLGSNGAKDREHGREALHEVADSDQFVEYAAFTEWAIKNHGHLLDLKSDGDLTPLHLAIRKGNHRFVELVLEHTDADRIASLLSHRANPDLTCLHFAIKYRSPFTETFIARAMGSPKTSESNPAQPAFSLALTSGSGPDVGLPARTNIFKDATTPLHMAMTVNEADDSDEYEDSDDDLSDDGSDLGSTEDDDDGDGSHSVGTNSNSGEWHQPGYPRGSPKPNQAYFRGVRRATTGELTRSHTARTKSGHEASFHLPTIVKRLIEACPDALLERNAEDETPFQARLTTISQARNRGEHGREEQGRPGISKSEAERAAQYERERREMIESDEILSYMREYITDNFDRRRAMKALYKVGDERVLEFDLSGLPYSKINSDFLDGLGKVLRFEGMLKYVALPRLEWDDDGDMDEEYSDSESEDDADVAGAGGGGTQQEKSSKSKGAGLWDMYPIFKWLARQHVKTVLKVAVIDDAYPSHSDKAIERCLSRFDIRVWNWYKVDLSCSVILKAAKHVRDVTLYSSGNNAVLMGWSSPEGLLKLQDLKKVHVFVQEGLESPRRLARNMRAFAKALSPGINVTWEIQKPDPHYSSVFTEGTVEKETEPRWMKAMVDFAEFLKRAHLNANVAPIKIAVIDDGIDTALDDFTGKIQVGESFYRLSELTGRRGAYYVPSGPHGTLMAQLICRVCPVVKLYIAQLEVLPGQDGRRSFTVESATEAIRWAKDQGVDIISMSWSIGSNLPLCELEAALDEAHKERIIMFCASIDEGPTAVDRTYPGKNANCIKIGASTWSGARLSWVSESNSQFLLPGEAPPLKTAASLASSLGKKSVAGGSNTVAATASSAAAAAAASMASGYPHRGLFGSSVATALAAGLAGVLLYCDRLLGSSRVLAPGSTPAAVQHFMPLPTPSIAAGPSPIDAGVAGPSIVRRQSDVPYVEYLRHEGKMMAAFHELSKGTHKFIQIWEELPKNPERLVWDDSEEGRASRRELELFMARFHR